METSQNILVGLGVAAASIVLVPFITKISKPIAVKGAQGVLLATDKMGQLVEKGKNQLEEFLEEAKEMQKKSRETKIGAMAMDDMSSVMDELKNERNEMSDQIKNLSEQIMDLKNHLQGLTPAEQ